MYIPSDIRSKVFERAFHLCEYCLLHKSDLYFPLQIEHIISQKHLKSNELSNLASACYLCNRNKGSDLSTVLPPNLDVIRLYRPRTDKWIDHFEISNEGIFVPKNKIAEAIIKVLKLNSDSRVNDRVNLIRKEIFLHSNVNKYWNFQAQTIQ